MKKSEQLKKKKKEIERLDGIVAEHNSRIIPEKIDYVRVDRPRRQDETCRIGNRLRYEEI